MAIVWSLASRSINRNRLTRPCMNINFDEMWWKIRIFFLSSDVRRINSKMIYSEEKNVVCGLCVCIRFDRQRRLICIISSESRKRVRDHMAPWIKIHIVEEKSWILWFSCEFMSKNKWIGCAGRMLHNFRAFIYIFGNFYVFFCSFLFLLFFFL